MVELHPCIPIYTYRLQIGLNKTIFEQRRPLSKFSVWFIQKILKWEIEQL